MDAEQQPEAPEPAAEGRSPRHIVVLLDAEVPDDLGHRGHDHETTTLDLRVATAEDLHKCAGDEVARITLVVPGWTHLRLASLPARLLPETRNLLVRMTEDPSHVLRRTATAGLRMKGMTVRWGSTPAGNLDLQFTMSIARSPSELLHSVIGWDLGPLHVPLRIGLTERALEPYVVGNPHVRYVGIDDVTISAGTALTAVDLVLRRARGPDFCGVGVPTATGLPMVRVLAGRVGGVQKLHESQADPAVLVPPVDTWMVNPAGFEAHDGSRTARTVAAAAGAATDVTSTTGETLFRVSTGAPLTRRQVHLARRLRFVRTLGRAFPGPVAEARFITQLAAAGVPIVARDLTPALSRLLGPDVTTALEEITPGLLADPLLREVASVRLRRAALRNHGAGARMRALASEAGLRVPPPPTVSVVLVTKRPAYLTAALAQIGRQTWDQLEVVLGLHGEGFSRRDVRRAVAACPRPITVVPIPGERSFGDALNAATAAASGDYITKWDDDDLYGADHVLDLLLAADYSGATVVGKGREFIALEERGAIVRGTNRTAERMVRFVAGGTLLFQRHVLAALGGWRPISAAVDQAFLRQVLDAGGTIYRTHGFGYILRRHGQGHTWDAEDEYFLQPGVTEWPKDSWVRDVVLETDLSGREAEPALQG